MNIALATPTYGQSAWIMTQRSIQDAIENVPPDVRVYTKGFGMDSSALTWTFNSQWAHALNMREELGLRWFVMLHADMASPDPLWLAKLVSLAESHGLFALSAAASLKCPGNLTNMAVKHKDGSIARVGWEQLQAMSGVVTADQVREHLDGTLLMNTGMLALRVDMPLSEYLCFDVENEIVRLDDGKFEARFVPEDWKMSMWLAEAGAPYGVTRDIVTIHHGAADFMAGGG